MNELIWAAIIGVFGIYLFFFAVSFSLMYGTARVRAAVHQNPGKTHFRSNTDHHIKELLKRSAIPVLEPACKQIQSNRSDCLPIR